MAVTTNYNWTTPDDTNLVKDGAAAIRSLGTAIDTTVFNNASAGIAKTIVDAKGDIIAATAADTVSRLAVGANDTVLTADSSTATGLKWAAVAGGGMTLLSTTSLSGTEVTISSINQTYNNLIIIGTGITWNTGSTRLRIEPNAVETSGTYSGVLGATNNRFDSIIPFGSSNFASNADSAFLLTINDYTSAAYKPTIYMGANPTDNSATTTYFGGLMTTTSAITSIKIVTNLGTPTLGGTVRIYGVK